MFYLFNYFWLKFVNICQKNCVSIPIHVSSYSSWNFMHSSNFFYHQLSTFRLFSRVSSLIFFNFFFNISILLDPFFFFFFSFLISASCQTLSFFSFSNRINKFLKVCKYLIKIILKLSLSIAKLNVLVDNAHFENEIVFHTLINKWPLLTFFFFSFLCYFI